MSALALATHFASGRLKKYAYPIVAADKARRTNPYKHSIRYRARQKISIYGQTLASYVTLKNRAALQEMREHRQRLLHESRMHKGSWVSVENLSFVLQQDISVIDTAL